jgi:hypothetical protein
MAVAQCGLHQMISNYISKPHMHKSKLQMHQITPQMVKAHFQLHLQTLNGDDKSPITPSYLKW